MRKPGSLEKYTKYDGKYTKYDGKKQTYSRLTWEGARDACASKTAEDDY